LQCRHKQIKMKKKKAIHCKTRDQAMKVLDILKEKGYKWVDDTPLMENLNYSHYERYTVYYIYTDRSVTYARIDNGQNIIPASKYIKKHTKKQLLKQAEEANEAITPQPHSGLDLDTFINWPKREVILNTYLTDTQQELWPAFEALCELLEIYRKIDLPEQEKDYPIYTPMFLYNGESFAQGWNLVYKILQFPNMDTCDEFIKENKALLEKAKTLL